MSYITVEDINTILLKWGDVVIPPYTVHEVPEITITDNLYRGNSNPVTDIISLPTNIEYTVYFENKPVTEIDLPRDYGDTCRLRVVSKSYYPYVNIDVFIEVPVVTKHLTTLEDLNTYRYGYIDNLANINGEINNNIYIECRKRSGLSTSVVDECNLTVTGNVTFNGDLYFLSSKITNNGTLEFMNANKITFSGSSTDYYITNHFELKMHDIGNIDITQPFVLNNNYFAIENNTLRIAYNNPAPAIYNTGDLIAVNNNFRYDWDHQYNNFSVCLFRADNVDIDKLLTDNGIIYDNITATIEETMYTINGTGVCYAKIDDDTIYIKNLEVTEDV